MTDQAETGGEDTLRSGIEEALGVVPEAESVEPVVKSDTSGEEVLDSGSAASEDAGSDTPGDAAPKVLAKALDDIKRAGLTTGLKGKSEAYILELAAECDTNKRQRDREHTDRQNQERDTVGQPLGKAASAKPGAPDDDGAASSADSPATPETDFTPLVEEFGEDAARPVIDAIGALQRSNAELRTRLDAQEQERQLAPVLAQANEILDGMVQTHPDLSKSESRPKILEAADKLSAAFAEKYSALPEGERMSAILREAVLLEMGPGTKAVTPSKPRRKAEAASSRSNATTDIEDTSLTAGIRKALEAHNALP